jgi:AcrR family transcriptional regulator
MALIYAAERLVAQNGVAGVTIAAITEAAKALNASAVQYHFGSLEALLKSVLEYRFATTNAARLVLLQTIDRSDLRALVGILVRPLAATFSADPQHNWHLRFLRRIHESGAFTSLKRSRDIALGWNMVRKLISEALLLTLPPPVIELRFAFARTVLIFGLAEVEARLGEPGSLHLSGELELVIDSIVAILLAPLSSETQRALRHSVHRRD